MTQNKPIVAVEGAELEGGEAGMPAAGEYRALGGSAVELGGDAEGEVANVTMASCWPERQWRGYVLVKK